MSISNDIVSSQTMTVTDEMVTFKHKPSLQLVTSEFESNEKTADEVETLERNNNNTNDLSPPPPFDEASYYHQMKSNTNTNVSQSIKSLSVEALPSNIVALGESGNFEDYVINPPPHIKKYKNAKPSTPNMVSSPDDHDLDHNPDGRINSSNFQLSSQAINNVIQHAAKYQDNMDINACAAHVDDVYLTEKEDEVKHLIPSHRGSVSLSRPNSARAGRSISITNNLSMGNNNNDMAFSLTSNGSQESNISNSIQSDPSSRKSVTQPTVREYPYYRDPNSNRLPHFMGGPTSVHYLNTDFKKHDFFSKWQITWILLFHELFRFYNQLIVYCMFDSTSNNNCNCNKTKPNTIANIRQSHSQSKLTDVKIVKLKLSIFLNWWQKFYCPIIQEFFHYKHRIILHRHIESRIDYHHFPHKSVADYNQIIKNMESIAQLRIKILEILPNDHDNIVSSSNRTVNDKLKKNENENENEEKKDNENEMENDSEQQQIVDRINKDEDLIEYFSQLIPKMKGFVTMLDANMKDEEITWPKIIAEGQFSQEEWQPVLKQMLSSFSSEILSTGYPGIIYCCQGWLHHDDIVHVSKLFPTSCQIMHNAWIKKWKASAVGWMLDLKDNVATDLTVDQGCLICQLL